MCCVDMWRAFGVGWRARVLARPALSAGHSTFLLLLSQTYFLPFLLLEDPVDLELRARSSSPRKSRVMQSVRALLLLLVAFVASTQAFMVQTAGKLGLQRAAASEHWTRIETCPCMACRTNLKKEKRQRNRANSFRFKKGGFTKRRFTGVDYAAEAKKAEEDNAFYTMVFTYSAEAAALAEEEAKKAPKEESKE